MESDRVLSDARIYDYYLGGQVNNASDREAARLLMRLAPGIGSEARSNRAFLVRVVRELTDLGIEQFLDVGAGIPFSPNVHEVAPHAKVVYVDNDETALRETRIAAGENPRIAVVEGDLRDPQSIFRHPRVAAQIDPMRPVATLLLGVLHCIKDDEEVRQITDQIRSHMSAGSFLVISHGTSEGPMKSADDQIFNGGLFPRSRDRISECFTGMQLLKPGIVPVEAWRPGQKAAEPPETVGWRMVGGVGRL